eukprot:g15432.t1
MPGNEEIRRPPLESPSRSRDGVANEDIDPLAKEACAAWERSLRPGQYFSEKGGHRPMRHRTQAVQGHPGARAWPRGPDGGAWGPQDLSPIPSERGFLPLVPSPTTSPGRRPRSSKGREGFFAGDGPHDDSLAVADAVAAEVGCEGVERETLRPFEPIALQDERLPPPPPAPPLDAPWKPPPPGFDARTLRRQASALRGEAAAAHRDEEAVRVSSLHLAEVFRGTVENGKENASLAKERLRCLHAALRRLRGERARHGEAVEAAVAWQESLEELREKLASSEERRKRAERAKGDAQRALAAAVDANRAAEAEVTPLEGALEAAVRRDDVAAEIERQGRQEELADAFLRRPRCRRRRRQYLSPNSGGRRSSTAQNLAWFIARGEGSGGGGHGVGDETDAAAAAAAAFAVVEQDEGEGTTPSLIRTSPLLLPTMAWGFRVFTEACRRSRGMRRLAAARKARSEAERRVVLGEAFAAWAVEVALVRGGREARRRRAEETARLCLARWKVFAAFEARFRAERWRHTCLRVMVAWRGAVEEARFDRDLDRRREALVLLRCFRGWRVLRAKSTLTPQELLDRSRAARRHRLGRLFEAWHLAALASSASSTAVVQGFRRRRHAATLVADFRAWASLSRARRWRRRVLLRRGMEALASLAAPLRYSAAAATVLTSDGPDSRRQRLRRTGRGWDGAASAVAGGLAGPDEPAPLSLAANSRTRGGLTRRDLARTSVGRHKMSTGGATVYDVRAVASAHRRRVGLSRGLRALLRTSPGELRRTRQLYFVLRGSGGGRGAVVSVRAARGAFLTWSEAASWRRRARHGMDVSARACRRSALVRAVQELRRFAVDAARQRRAARVGLLRRSFAAFRQGCAISGRQHSACGALQNALVNRRLALLGTAMERLATVGGAVGESGAAAEVATALAPAARRRRQREALEAAWRWWVGGWVRRQAEEIRICELIAQRQKVRDRDLAEQIMKAQKESAELQKEATSVGAELQRTKILVREQEEALAASRRSLAEAAAAAAAIRARLGPAGRLKASKAGKKEVRTPGAGAGAVATATAADAVTGDGRHRGVHKSVGDERARSGRVALQRRAARVLAEAEARRKEAEDAAVTRERAMSSARGKLAGQEEADRAALEGALEAARRHAQDLERGRIRVSEAEGERLRVRGATESLLEKAAKGTSVAVSERAALTLEVSTAEARAREMMLILDERQQEAAALRRELAAKSDERQEKRLMLGLRAPARSSAVEPTPSAAPPPRPPPLALTLCEEAAVLSAGKTAGGSAAAAADVPMDGLNVQELKASIALLQRKVEAARAR